MITHLLVLFATAFSHVTSDNTSLLPSSSSPSTEAAITTSQENGRISIERHLINVTKESGDNVIMRCEFRSQTPVAINWYRNEAPLEPVKGKFEVKLHTAKGKYSSRLKIHQVDVHDMGFYKCTASSENDNVETVGVLRVEGGSYVMSSQSMPDFNPIIPEFPGLFPER